MSFFEPPPPPPEPRERRLAPVWGGPPENELGVPVPIRLVLVKTGELAIGIGDAVAYSTGITAKLLIRRRRDEPRFMHPMHPMMRPNMAAGGELPPELLRFGVELADGRRATTTGGRPRPDGGEPAVVLAMRGGSGGGRTYEQTFWLWPLPPPGTLTFVVEWPALGVEQTQVQVESEPFAEAAMRSERLWEDDDAARSSSSSFATAQMQIRKL